MNIGILLLGMIGLVLGSDSFIKGATAAAVKMGIRPFIVGVLMVGFGTSAPELILNVTAAFKGSDGMAMGNIIGSNIANVGLILGVASIILPLTVKMNLIRREGLFLLVSYLVLWFLSLNGALDQLDGVMLLIGFVAMLFYMLRATDEPAEVQAEFEQATQTREGKWRTPLRIIIGLALMLFASHWVVKSAMSLALAWGWSEFMIGLTIVAVGTSLPELAATVMAVYQKQPDIAVGNVVGSCLFNILLVLGASALVTPIAVPQAVVWMDLPVMMAFALMLLPMIWKDKLITRGEGIILLTCFIGYMGFQGWWALH